MSVKELKFIDSLDTLEIKKEGDGIKLEIVWWWSDRINSFTLDHNQAHLLMLYLQEHLK